MREKEKNTKKKFKKKKKKKKNLSGLGEVFSMFKFFSQGKKRNKIKLKISEIIKKKILW